MNPTTIFFCIGCQKTGTTLLARVIDQHPSAACLFESYALMPNLPASLLNLNGDKWKTHGFTADQAADWSRRWRGLAHQPLHRRLARRLLGLKYAGTKTFGNVLREILSDFSLRMNVHVVGDKWPWYVDYIDLMLELFPQAKFLYNVRDPRGLWNSGETFRDRGQGDATLDEMLAKDKVIEPYLSRENFLALRYEDMLYEPHASCTKIYQFLGLDFLPEYLEYDREADPLPERWGWVKEAYEPFDTKHATKWEQKLDGERIRQIEDRAADFMKKWRYEPFEGLERSRSKNASS